TAGELVGPEPKACEQQRVTVAREPRARRVVPRAVVADATEVERKRRGCRGERLAAASSGGGAQGGALVHKRVAGLFDSALELLGLPVRANALRRRERAPEADAGDEDHREGDTDPRGCPTADRLECSRFHRDGGGRGHEALGR